MVRETPSLEAGEINGLIVTWDGASLEAGEIIMLVWRGAGGPAAKSAGFLHVGVWCSNR